MFRKSPRSGRKHKAWGVSPRNTLIKVIRARGAGDSRLIASFCRSLRESIERRSIVSVHGCKVIPNRLHVLRIRANQLNHITLVASATGGKL